MTFWFSHPPQVKLRATHLRKRSLCWTDGFIHLKRAKQSPVSFLRLAMFSKLLGRRTELFGSFPRRMFRRSKRRPRTWPRTPLATTWRGARRMRVTDVRCRGLGGEGGGPVTVGVLWLGAGHEPQPQPTSLATQRQTVALWL